jgi:hypothetical protein
MRGARSRSSHVEMTGIQHSSGWSLQKRARIGLAAIVVVGLLEDAARLRRRAGRALTAQLQDVDASARHGAHRSEVGMFIAGLSGTRRHGR